MAKLSVIVPAFNEARYIGKTLLALRKQTIKDLEIIVKDGESPDETVAVAKRFADNVISCRDSSVAQARNEGAKHASGDLLVFVDADTILPPNMLERFLELMKNREIIGGSCRKIPQNRDVLDRIMYEFVNLSTFLCSLFGVGGAHGNCMLVRKDVFERIGGFNPKILVAEEQDLVRRAVKFGKFVFLLGLSVAENPRRVRRWGRLRLYFAWLAGMLRSFRAGGKPDYERIR